MRTQPYNYTLLKQLFQTISLCLICSVLYNNLMRVINRATGQVLTHNLKIASSIKDRALGLIILDKKQSMLLYTRFGIHTIGLKHPIDVVILDNKNLVVKLKKSFKPNNIFIWNPKFSKVLELPSGTIEKSKTKVGDALEIHHSNNLVI